MLFLHTLFVVLDIWNTNCFYINVHPKFFNLNASLSRYNKHTLKYNFTVALQICTVCSPGYRTVGDIRNRSCFLSFFSRRIVEASFSLFVHRPASVSTIRHVEAVCYSVPCVILKTSVKYGLAVPLCHTSNTCNSQDWLTLRP